MKRFLFAIFLISVILPGCSKTGSNQPRILVSPKGLSHSFWVTVKNGAEAAGKDFHADVIWKGPAVETDIAGQIAILEDYINKKVDAIVLAACDTKALIPVVEKAHRKGIKIITIDSGLDSDVPLSLIATDNVAAARKAAHVLGKLIHQKGKVACIPFVPGAATSIMREEGFKQGLKDFPEIKLVAVQYSQSDVATAMNVMENILTAHPDLDGVFTANEAGTIGAVQALVSRNKTGRVKVVGFDAAPNEIEALQAGHVQALIVQNPYKMGYKGVEMAVLALQGKKIPKRIDTGVYVVTMDNLNTPEIQKLLQPMLH